VLVAVALVVPTGDDDVPVAALPARPTIAGSLELQPRLPRAGEEVVVRATLTADRPLALHGLTVRVRDAAGTGHDFPETGERSLGTTPQDITLRRAFPAAGDYTYYLAYRLDGDWVSLQPWERFTVR